MKMFFLADLVFPKSTYVYLRRNLVKNWLWNIFLAHFFLQSLKCMEFRFYKISFLTHKLYVQEKWFNKVSTIIIIVMFTKVPKNSIALDVTRWSACRRNYPSLLATHRLLFVYRTIKIFLWLNLMDCDLRRSFQHCEVWKQDTDVLCP